MTPAFQKYFTNSLKNLIQCIFIVFIPLLQLLLGMGFILCLWSDCLKYHQKVAGSSHNSCHYCAGRHILPSRSLLQCSVHSRVRLNTQYLPTLKSNQRGKASRSVPAWFLHVCDSVCDVFSNRFLLSASDHQEQWQ